MNSIFIYSQEYSNGQVDICGPRVGVVQENHQLRAGIEVACAVEGIGRGRLVITQLTDSHLAGHYVQVQSVLPRVMISLAVAVPRPQTIKKVLELGATVGVQEIQLFVSDNTRKNYLQSKQLRQEVQEKSLLRGLEQAWDSEKPKVVVGLGIDELVSCEGGYLPVVADVAEDVQDRECLPPLSQATRLFIGPERGWTQRERELFREHSCVFIDFGVRYLRVETACAVGLGKLGAL
jgi:16S rRNA (uracil1498-N3)-methyltransferase